jgi:serine protease Do
MKTTQKRTRAERARRYIATILAGGLVIALLVATGTVEVEFHWSDGKAKAVDSFGNDGADEPVQTAQATSEDRFWREDSGAEPIVPRGVPASFADLADRASDGVVNIKTSSTVRSSLPQFEDFFGGPGSPFEEFFRQPRQGPGREQKRSSLGTGFVISPDGFIVTNNHVIEGTDEVLVAWEDGTEREARIVGRDPATDIALIQVEADDLFALPLGNSEEVRPGEWVVAIGNPFGLGHTVTAGIVSGKHRVIGQGKYEDFIQTDAAINFGNSGGPLLNLSGEVIGINTAINARANTIGFAVPIDMAKTILPQLKTAGHVTRGWLGVVIQKITPELAESFDLESQEGALVSNVLPDGPASDAGVEHGDVIVQFDGKQIEDWNDLPRVVAETPVGKKVDMVVLRDGKRKKLRAKVAKLEQDEEPVQLAEAEGGAGEFGMRVQNITPDLADQLGMDQGEGVVVTGVEPGSAAEEAGLRSGDVILEVDKKEVSDVKQLRSQLADADKSTLLLIRRGEATIFVPVKRKG